MSHRTAATPVETAHMDAFFHDCCYCTEDGSLVTAHDLTGVYLTWCEQHEVAPLSQSRLCRAMHENGFELVRHSHDRCYVGLALHGRTVTDYILSTY